MTAGSPAATRCRACSAPHYIERDGSSGCHTPGCPLRGLLFRPLPVARRLERRRAQPPSGSSPVR
jgi:hypothetical protein